MSPLRWLVLCVFCTASALSGVLTRSSTAAVEASERSFAAVDPLAKGRPWQASGDHEDAEFGYSVASAGDINGDGYDDVMMGAPRFEYHGLVQGRAYMYQGSAGGLSASPSWTVQGGEDWGWFGGSVAGAGDVNGDGYDDVIVGAPDTYVTEVGQAYVYLGSAAGLSATPNWTAEGDQGGDRFGGSVAGAGDVNGDGYDDLIVGSPGYGGEQGRAFVYYGSAAGPSTTPAWIGDGDQSLADFGTSVGTAGDVDGDGYDDVVVGSPYYTNGETSEGRAFVYYGSEGGPSAAPDWLAEGDQSLAQFGTSVGTAGDVNGDGFDDVIAGAPYTGGSIEGEAFLYLGSAGGLGAIHSWVGQGKSGDSYFGHSVAAAGDVDGDGFDDVVVGAYLSSHGEAGEGRAYVFRGGLPSGLSGTPDHATEADQDDAYLGYSVSTAGDLNGDGYAEVIVGAYLYDHQQTNEGVAFVYRGSPRS